MAILERSSTGVFSSLSAEAAEVADRVRAGVVTIRGEGGGHGSGIIWQTDGVVITNDHVMARDRAEIILFDGRKFVGEVFRRDRDRDLAALRVQGQDLPAVPIGDSRSLRPGELVLAVGNPLGVPQAVSIGIISGIVTEVRLGRRQMPEMVQADVDLYPGNSGGALVNAHGRVVGINSMVTGPGIALAVPSHAAQQLLEASPNGRAYLGITIRGVELPPVLATPLGIPTNEGMMIHGVAEGSPAERAGLLLGDLVIAMDGRVLNGGEDLSRRLATISPRRPVRLTVLRGGKLLDLSATPEERREDREAERAA